MELKYLFGQYEEHEFNYEVDTESLLNAAVIYYCDYYGVSSDDAKKLLRGLLIDEVILYEEDEGFIEFAEEFFREDAIESYEEYCEYTRDVYGYYGVSRYDF